MTEINQAHIEPRKVSDLTNWEDNPRTVRKEDFARLIEQIKRLGAYKPLLINQDNIVLGGNMRLRALRELGITEIACAVVKTENPSQMIEYALSDNDQIGVTDEDKLAELVTLNPINSELFSINSAPMKPVSVMLNELQAEITIQDEEPEVDLEGEPDSQPNQIYHLGSHRLYCGDATSADSYSTLLGDDRATMVFTDPPYNIDYRGGMHADGSQTKRRKILNDKMPSQQFYQFLYDALANMLSYTRGAFYVCMSSSELHNLWKAFTDAGGHWQAYIIWAKNRFTLSRTDYQNQHEPIMYGLDESTATLAEGGGIEAPDALPIMYGWANHDWYGGRKQGNVWQVDRPTNSPDHPTTKPVALVARAIRNSSRRGEIILDPFSGSGTTLITAEQLGRVCMAMELDPRYCDVIRKRYWKFTHAGNEEEWEEGTR